MNKKTYQQRVDELEAEGLTNCDAKDIAEGELFEGKLRAGSARLQGGCAVFLSSEVIQIRYELAKKRNKYLATA